VRASAAEVAGNPRARSAVMRVAEKLSLLKAA
jgi:16S rRNA C1402 N4-methylase RsmH